MDEDRIGLVLAKTSELRSKIVSCISGTAPNSDKEGKEGESKELENHGDGVEEESESLLNIKDALESLEGQLSSLQALQQQQWYEKEAALAEIEYSQKKLLKELKEYKGKDLEVIHEAIAFASETEDNTDLLLPPYPSRPSHPVVPQNGYLPTFASTRKFPQNWAITGNFKNIPNNLQKSESNQRQSGLWGPLKSVKVLVGTAAKAALTIVGVITILSLAGFEPRLRKRDSSRFKISDLFRLQENNNEKEGGNEECPPGKVAVIENGETRCVVKERVEIPFESVVDTPDVSYGCG